MVMARQTLISKELLSEDQLRVPLYQRQYQWKKSQWDELWADILRLARDREVSPKETHFLGSIVLATPPDGGDDLLIVDGQQRLITIGILLSALRDGETAMPQQVRDRIDRCLFIRQSGRASQLEAELKVVPTQSDEDAYARILFGEEHTEEHLITKAYGYFCRRISELRKQDVEVGNDEAEESEDSFGIKAVDIARATLHGLECVAITTESDDNAHRIFESLNNKGTSLTQADLIRNYVFMRLNEPTPKFYKFSWQPLERRFDPDRFTDLFWLDLILSGRSATQRQTYVEQQKSMNKMTPAEIKLNIKRINTRADVWELILHPEKEKSARIRRRLHRIQDWGTSTAAPTLMYLLEQRQKGTASWGEVERAMIFLESYFVRRVAIGRATMNMNRVLMAAPTQLAKDRRPVDVALQAHLSGEGKHWATDDELRDLATSTRFYNHGRGHQKTLILRWIEEGLRDHEDELDHELTVEHVMPQILTDAWKSELRCGLLPKQTIGATHENLVHTLGNLTLTKRNSELSNRSFNAKKAVLKERGSGLKLTSEIISKNQWGPDEIRKRSKLMVERIIINWPGPLSPEND